LAQKTCEVVRPLDEVISSLHTAYDAGRLVPFVGSGISMPYCRGWSAFIASLAQSLRAGPEILKDLKPGPTPNPELLNRVADRLATWLRLRQPDEQQDILCEALRSPGSKELPPQATALARGYWPLIITSNYDDLLPAAPSNRGRGVQIMGRSPHDCTQVVRGLDLIQPPTIWYIQGHVAGVAPRQTSSPATEMADALLNEIVIGHQQYQQAINGSNVFRRAFSEVFRRRSLLFVGSGLTESYFVNLIAESLFSLGPSAMPHYALFTAKDLEKADPEFLAVRLGITPIVYGESHTDLPGALNRIHREGQNLSGAKEASSHVLSSLVYSVARKQATKATVTLSFSRLPAPSPGACVVLNVGLDNSSAPPLPEYGPMVRNYHDEHPDLWNDDVDPIPIGSKTRNEGWLFEPASRARNSAVLFVGARDSQGNSSGVRSLEIVSKATASALRHIEAKGKRREVVMGVLGAGGGVNDSPVYRLAAQLAGIRDFLAQSPERAKPSLRKIEIFIVDRGAWAAVAQGRLDVAGILTSRLTRVLVRIADGHGRWEEYAMSVPHSWSVEAVLHAYNIVEENVEVTAYPLPTQHRNSISQLPVFPGMIVEVHPQRVAVFGRRTL